MTTAGALLRDATLKLTAAGLETARLDARILLAQVLGIEPSNLFNHPEMPVAADLGAAFSALIERRVGHEPVPYLIGRREFWSLAFEVGPETLIPRPDTETVVALAMTVMPRPPERLLDIGTGSGCIVISLLHEWPMALGIGTDISGAALRIAASNATRLGVGERAEFRLGSWTAGAPVPFDLIVSNPPYVVRGDLAGLTPEVSAFEPMTALDGGVDGLDAYRGLIPKAFGALRPGGILTLEVGKDQAGAVLQLAGRAGLQHLRTEPDLASVPRAIAFQKPSRTE